MFNKTLKKEAVHFTKCLQIFTQLLSIAQYLHETLKGEIRFEELLVSEERENLVHRGPNSDTAAIAQIKKLNKKKRLANSVYVAPNNLAIIPSKSTQQCQTTTTD